MANLPYLVFTLTIFQFAAATNQQDCLKDTEVDYKTLHNHFYDFQTSYDNEVVGKFFACLWKKNGVMSADGISNKETFIDYFAKIAKISRPEAVRMFESDLHDFNFEGDEQVDAIRLVNSIKLGFFALTFNERGGGKDLLQILME